MADRRSPLVVPAQFRDAGGRGELLPKESSRRRTPRSPLALSRRRGEADALCHCIIYSSIYIGLCVHSHGGELPVLWVLLLRHGSFAWFYLQGWWVR